MKNNEEHIKIFKNLYDKVFDKNENIKACGREICKALIEISDFIETDVSHGDLKTGNMNIDNIKELNSKL